MKAQCGSPPPPGTSPIYAVDMDNDGFAPFDIAYYIEYVDRPLMENYFNVSSSGYNFVYYNVNNEIITAPSYTNVILNESGYMNFEYTGSGPLFVAQPPCYYPPPQDSGITLNPMPFDGDYDNDGILNVDEDTNGNLNLMDDDSDGDGQINLTDTSNILSVVPYTLAGISVYPNPVTNSFLHIDSTQEITYLTVHDISGRKVLQFDSPAKTLNVNTLQKGTYLVRISSEGNTVVRQIIVN